jgi:hypothetical protein
MNQPEERITASQNIPAARALEVVKLLIEDADGRRSYSDDPSGAFDAKKEGLDEEPLRSANYGDIPDNSRRALEALSVYELQLLSDLDRTFVEDGLWVDVPSPGRLMYK